METKDIVENSETSAVKVTRKHTAKKLGNDLYQYRGWIIKKYDNNYLNDDEIRGFQWNTYRNFDGYEASGTIDITSTLRDAKIHIDICVKRDLELVGNKQGVVTAEEFEVIANDNPKLPVRLSQSGGETYYSVLRHKSGVVYDLMKHFRPSF